jgi:hypothetical protein
MDAYKGSIEDVTAFIRKIMSDYCTLDPLELYPTRFIPKPLPCMFPAFLQPLDRYSDPLEDACPNDPSYLVGRQPTFVASMISWFEKHRHLQNQFQYHDEIHGMIFATAMPLYMETYAREMKQEKSLKHEYFMAAA